MVLQHAAQAGIMPRTPARITQADVARALRAARQTGAVGIEVKPDGTIRILLDAPPTAPVAVNEWDAMP